MVTTPNFLSSQRLPGAVRSVSTCALAVIGSVILGSAANANPNGAQVVNGTAHMVSHGNQMAITASDGAIINWRQFSVEAGQTTRFVQPGANARVLNRVVGHDPSRINGQLLANGRVFLINRNGIVFGAGSVIDTAGLVASTLGLSNEDFSNGIQRFSGKNAGTIVNRGYIRTSGDGDIVLIAPSIENHGVIETTAGELLLAAGESVVIESLDVEHVSFEVKADTGEVLNLGKLLTDNGAIGLFARHLHVGGEVRANKIARDGAGRIQLVAADTNRIAGLIIAQGDNSEIVIDGNQTTITQHARVSADHGGRLIAYGDQSLVVQGQLQAEDGFVDTSTGGGLHIAKAPRIGDKGQWLIDPTDINITATTDQADLSDIQGDVAEIGVDVITDGLKQGGEVIVSTVGTSGSGNGDINVLAAITHAGSGDLKLEASNDINVRHSINTTDVNVVLDAGGDVDVSADINGRSLTIDSQSIALNNAKVTTSASVTLKADDVTLHNAAVNTGQSVNVDATGTVIVSKGSRLSAASGIDIKSADFMATADTQLTSETGMDITASNSIRLTGDADTVALLVAADTINLDSPDIVLTVPTSFDGQLIKATTVAVVQGNVDCQECDLSVLIDARVTGINVQPKDDDTTDDSTDTGGSAGDSDDDDGSDVRVIDTSDAGTKPKQPASGGGQRLTPQTDDDTDDDDDSSTSSGSDAQLSNQDLVSSDIKNHDDNSAVVVSSIDQSATSASDTDTTTTATDSSIASATTRATDADENAATQAADSSSDKDNSSEDTSSAHAQTDGSGSDDTAAASDADTTEDGSSVDALASTDQTESDEALTADGKDDTTQESLDGTDADENAADEESDNDEPEQVADQTQQDSNADQDESSVASAQKPLQCS